jgi:hypothetical protein
MCVRYEDCRVDSLYELVVERAIGILDVKHIFSKKEVCSAAHIQTLRWDYVKRMLEEQGRPLLHVSESYFKHKRAAKAARIVPGKYMAIGRGKTVAGYADVVLENGHFALANEKYKKARALGCAKAADKATSWADSVAGLRAPEEVLQLT